MTTIPGFRKILMSKRERLHQVSEGRITLAEATRLVVGDALAESVRKGVNLGEILYRTAAVRSSPMDCEEIGSRLRGERKV